MGQYVVSGNKEQRKGEKETATTVGMCSYAPEIPRQELNLFYKPGVRGHDVLVNCVRTAMSKSVSKPKTFAAVNTIYSHKCAGHNALASTFVTTYEDSPVIFSVVGISRNR